MAVLKCRKQLADIFGSLLLGEGFLALNTFDKFAPSEESKFIIRDTR